MRELLNDLQADAPRQLELEGHRISEVNYEELVGGEREPITAVDGGSAILLKTTSNCVLFVRIIAVKMSTRKEIVKTEGYVLATAGKKTTVSFYTLEGKKEELFTIDESLETATNLGRKILEWRAVDAADGAMLWDGSLTPTNDVEARHQPRQEELLCLSKTTGTLGNWKVFSESPEQPWKAQAFDKTWFAKLHAKTKHYFRIDTTTPELIDSLVPWSKDPSFLGYPYPLILADQLARVSNEEAGVQKIRLQSLAGENWNALAEGSTASDAHEILDSMQY